MVEHTVSERERIAHVVRRLGMGADPRRAGDHSDVEAALAAAFDDPEPAPESPLEAIPADWDEVEDHAPYEAVATWWLERMIAGRQALVERMTWFWHDHFATSFAKVDNGYLMWRQYETIRRHALGNFATLLDEIARDPAMLVYLDGVSNTADAPNENYAREVMELHTLGVGSYSQDDVVAAARAFTGWTVNDPEEDYEFEAEPWAAAFLRDDHDRGDKSLLGVTGRLDMDQALDAILAHPAVGPHIAGSLFEELVGHTPDTDTAQHLGRAFAADFEIRPLVEAIVTGPAFVADTAVRAKVRTPVEKLVTLLQGYPREQEDFEMEWAVWWLEQLGYAPFLPPNPAGYPKGMRLLGPGQLAGSFALLGAVAEPGLMAVAELFARLGVFDVSDRSALVVGAARRPGDALALAFGSPEFALT